MQNITQQILSRTRLLRIIDQLNLYTESVIITSRPTKKLSGCAKILRLSSCVILATRDHGIQYFLFCA